MATASFTIDQPKKKPLQNADHLPRDGHTGMSFHTQRHFINVKQKMIDYVGEQKGFENGTVDLHPHFHHGFVDEKKLSKPRSLHSSPVAPRKHSSHHGSGTPRKHLSHHGSVTSEASSHKKHSSSAK